MTHALPWCCGLSAKSPNNTMRCHQTVVESIPMQSVVIFMHFEYHTRCSMSDSSERAVLGLVARRSGQIQDSF